MMSIPLPFLHTCDTFKKCQADFRKKSMIAWEVFRSEIVEQKKPKMRMNWVKKICLKPNTNVVPYSSV